MIHRNATGLLALAALCVVILDAQAQDISKYPDLKGVWRGTGGNKWPKPAPLTEEYRAIFQANVKDQEEGGQGDTPTVTCLPPGMPRQMNIYEPMQIIVTPEMTHLRIEHVHDSRRIYTDGRDWPEDMEPMFSGYSIGQWEDTDGDGRYDQLTVETRGMKGPRTFDSTGVPLHKDNKTVVKERIYLDKTNPDMIHNEITTIDHALTHPWTITKNYRRDTKVKQPYWWGESICSENNPHVRIGGEIYFVGADGNLMPAKKNQKPPSLKYFDQAKK